MILRMKTLLAGACASVVIASAAQASGSGSALCEADTLLLRDIVIMDASGRWDDQDILIEQGEISAIGSDLTVETGEPIAEIEMAGAVVRPRANETLTLFVRTSTRSEQPDTSADYIMPGMIADFTAFDGETDNSPIALEMRDGRISGMGQSCYEG